VLDLKAPEEEIRKGFSKGHKSDLKKSEKNNISVSLLSSEADWEAFCRIFARMNRKRGHATREKENEAFLQRAWAFLKRTGQGDGLVVKDEAGNLLGGILLVYQGTTVRYFKGAADPDQRQIPILHAALWEGIRRARAMGFRFFDFWGYNHFVDENDQVFHINRFKKGFGGSYSFYPKKMNLLFRPAMYRLYILLTGLQHRWKK
jgi:lipid II:glycine glycyltransferase (peptidoglycan interpeptide bridge formation enzyme)